MQGGAAAAAGGLGATGGALQPKVKRVTMKDKFLKSQAGLGNAAEVCAMCYVRFGV